MSEALDLHLGSQDFMHAGASFPTTLSLHSLFSGALHGACQGPRATSERLREGTQTLRAGTARL